jgi:prolyl oligopeptidase
MPPRDASGDPAGDDHGDATPPPPEDVFLEDLRSERSMRWVESENARALRAIVGPDRAIEDDPMFAALRAIYDDKKKIPNVRARGDLVYNFWQDQDHLKGIWRRTTMTEFAKEDPAWETVLDVDALAEKEGRSWVWKGPSFLDYGPGLERRVDRCVVKLRCAPRARLRFLLSSTTATPRFYRFQLFVVYSTVALQGTYI